jgi:hypothetical protein
MDTPGKRIQALPMGAGRRAVLRSHPPAILCRRRPASDRVAPSSVRRQSEEFPAGHDAPRRYQFRVESQLFYARIGTSRVENRFRDSGSADRRPVNTRFDLRRRREPPDKRESDTGASQPDQYMGDPRAVIVSLRAHPGRWASAGASRGRITAMRVAPYDEFTLKVIASPAGFEPATGGLENRCSVR